MEPSRTRPAGLLAAAILTVGGVFGVWACWRYFVDTQRGQLLDDAALRGSEIGRSTLWTGAQPVLDVVSVSFVVIVVGIASVMAIVRRRWLRIVQIVVLIGGANLTTQVLKREILDRPYLTDAVYVGNNSLPSGHVTVAASVAAIVLIAAPPGLRPLTAVGGAAYTALTGVSTMVGGWHRPADVVAAIAVVVAWSGIATAVTAVDRSEGRRPRVAFMSAVTTVLLGGGAVIALVIGGPMLLRVDRALAQGAWLGDRDTLFEAYAGSALAVVAAAAVAFALILVAHHVAAGPSRLRPSQELRDAAGRTAQPYPLA